MNRCAAARRVRLVALALAILPAVVGAQALPGASAGASTPAPRIDEEYTRIIRQNLDDPRITTELVDHLPASDTVPSPLKFFGRTVGAPGELTYAKDIARYYETLAQTSPRARFLKIGTTEEGRDIVLLAIADEATIGSLDAYRDRLAALTDPRITSEARAQELLKEAKPIYWITSGIHSPETGGPEMLIELAFRLIVEETPFIQNIRRNVITFITPVLEVDGREKQVDTYYFNKKRAPGDTRLPLVYWGQYVGHDNNRDGIGQFLSLTQAVTRATLEWRPTVIHDLHEAQAYLYASTGTGPYNPELDPIVTHEWWMLAENDVLELTKRGVPGAWTYGFYDGWVPNYMFFIAHTHNAIGRFYEVQGYGPDPYEVRPSVAATSKEWFRPNPPLPFIKWGPRNNVNIQQSALLFALQHVARNRELYIENYWLKNKRSVEKGRAGPTFGWVIPAGQRRTSDAVRAVNDLRRQGLEISVASSAFKAGDLDVRAGDFIVRADQPFRTLAAMYFSIQSYAPQNPAPYDDTGWTFQLLRDIRVVQVDDASILGQPMTRLAADAALSGGIDGVESVLIVDHTAENNLASFRFRHAGVRMMAAEEDFEIRGRKFRGGSVIVPGVDRPTAALLDTTLKELGLSALAVSALPAVKTHDLDLPRIGFVHHWVRTQDEGWWRAALDAYGIPYSYFSDQKLKDGRLRAKYDVIIFPHVGGSVQSQVGGIATTGSAPLPYRRTAETPNLGRLDSSDDIRGGMGLEGLLELAKFVHEGGTLITEGSTAAMFPAYGIVNDVAVEQPSQLFVRGSVLRGTFVDRSSPLAYGYDADLPVYFNQGPVFGTGTVARPDRVGTARSNRGPNAGLGQVVAPNAAAQRAASAEAESEPSDTKPDDRRQEEGAAEYRRVAEGAGFAAGDGRSRVIMRFPSNPGEMLLSGSLANGQYLSERALLIDERLGGGHLVMFALRPFWRWQTHGSYFLAFNAILNWNDLDSGHP